MIMLINTLTYPLSGQLRNLGSKHQSSGKRMAAGVTGLLAVWRHGRFSAKRFLPAKNAVSLQAQAELG
jgi:hypothetical protein